jgi:GNAT superfamily N-acetyltransferase
MTVHKIDIVRPEESLSTAWRGLYDGYAAFYKRQMTDEIAGVVWGWLMDPDHELEGALALLDGTAVGLAHYRRMPSPLRGSDIGFLDDIFVAPEGRGRDIGRALFAHLEAAARAKGWGVVRWITADDNYRARGLYDTLARKTSWNLYEMQI